MLEQENKYCVYLHINPITKEIFYVGIGLKCRAQQSYKRSERWINYVNKYGFDYAILFKDLTWPEACIIEKFLIKVYGRIDNNNGILLNMTDGGDGTGGYEGYWKGKKRKPASTKTKLKCKLNSSKYWLGKTISEEIKVKISNTLRGRKLPKSTIDKMKGRVAWNKGLKGVKLSEETKLKISQSNKNAWEKKKMNAEL